RGAVDDAGTAGQVAVLRGLADVAVHLGHAAFVQQVDDQLELVHAFEIGDLRLVAGFDQGLEALHDQFGDAAAQDRLVAEQIGLGLLGKARRDQAAAGAADTVRIRLRPRQRLAGDVLVHGDEAGHAVAGFVFATDQGARTLRRDEDDVPGLARLDLLEVD